MLVNLQDLPANGRQWNWTLPKSLLEDPLRGTVDALVDLESDVVWNGEIRADGQIFILQGQWCLTLKRQCDRCNMIFSFVMQGESVQDFSLFPLGKEMLEEDEIDTCEHLDPPGLVDLLDVLRESVWLAYKPVVVCDGGCLGLCQHCGVNLNIESCKCTQTHVNSAFAALKNIKFD
ncbi:MAG: DUF177 domain-containing protein [Zetaproteobacteria bacterium]|nr:DUF177 domain-containing protein [Zetaproteobacteria bacterium]